MMTEGRKRRNPFVGLIILVQVVLTISIATAENADSAITIENNNNTSGEMKALEDVENSLKELLNVVTQRAPTLTDLKQSGPSPILNSITKTKSKSFNTVVLKRKDIINVDVPRPATPSERRNAKGNASVTNSKNLEKEEEEAAESNAVICNTVKYDSNDLCTRLKDVLNGVRIATQRVTQGEVQDGRRFMVLLKENAVMVYDVIERIQSRGDFDYDAESIKKELHSIIQEVSDAKAKVKGSENNTKLDETIIFAISMGVEGGFILIALIVLMGVILHYRGLRKSFLEDSIMVGYHKDDDVSLDLLEYKMFGYDDLKISDRSQSFVAGITSTERMV